VRTVPVCVVRYSEIVKRKREGTISAKDSATDLRNQFLTSLPLNVEVMMILRNK
jgi:hypothetical protein